MALIIFRILLISVVTLFVYSLGLYLLSFLKAPNHSKELGNLSTIENVSNNIVGYSALNYNIEFWQKLNYEEEISFLKGYIWAFIFTNTLIVKEMNTAEEQALSGLLVRITQVSYKRINEYIKVLNLKAENNENLKEAISITLLGYHVDKNLLEKLIVYEDKDFLTNRFNVQAKDIWGNLKNYEKTALLNGYFSFLEILEFYLKNEELVNIILTREKNKYVFNLKIVEKINRQINRNKPSLHFDELANFISALYQEIEFENTSFEVLIMLISEAGVTTLDDEALNLIKMLNNFNFKHHNTELKH